MTLAAALGMFLLAIRIYVFYLLWFPSLHVRLFPPLLDCYPDRKGTFDPLSERWGEPFGGTDRKRLGLPCSVQ